MTTVTRQRKPANQLSSTKPQFKQLTKKKQQRLSTTNIQVCVMCMHAGKFWEYILVKAVVLYVHEKKGFWIYHLWVVHLTSVCGGWRLQSVHYQALQGPKKASGKPTKGPWSQNKQPFSVYGFIYITFLHTQYHWRIYEHVLIQLL
jgi:hypothetical protein